MKPAWSLRNSTPRLTAELSAKAAVPGVAVLGQIVHGQSAEAAPGRSR